MVGRSVGRFFLFNRTSNPDFDVEKFIWTFFGWRV
jgi:hypothetical protein